MGVDRAPDRGIHVSKAASERWSVTAGPQLATWAGRIEQEVKVPMLRRHNALDRRYINHKAAGANTQPAAAAVPAPAAAIRRPAQAQKQQAQQEGYYLWPQKAALPTT